MFAINAPSPRRRRWDAGIAVGHALRRAGRPRAGDGLHGRGARARATRWRRPATARWPSSPTSPRSTAAARDGTLAMVLHLEGAEAIDPGPVGARRVARGRRALDRAGLEPGQRVRPRRALPLPGLAGHRARAHRRRARARAPLRRAGHRGRPQPSQRRRASPTSRAWRRRRSSSRTPRATRCAPRRATSPTTSCARSAAATGSSGSSSAPPSCAPTAPTTPTRRWPRSWPTCATPPSSSASIASAWARTSTARRCPPSSATSPPCPACSTRCATTASAPTRWMASRGATGGACCAAAWGA